MIFAYLTLLFVSPQDWFGPFVGLPVDYVLYPLWAVVLVLTGRARYVLRYGWQDALLVLFVLWMVASAVVNAGAGIDLHQLFMYAKWIVLYKLVAASLSDMDSMRRAGLLIVLAALVLTVESIQHIHDPNQLGWAGQSLGWVSQSAMEQGVAGRTRWVSIFDGPGVFCVIFTLALPFLLRFLDRSFALFKRAGAAVLLPPLLLAIYYTGSRGGFLTTLAILGMHFGARTKISVTKLTAVAALLLVVFAAAPAYLTNVRDEDRSAQHRVDMWIEGLEMAQADPVFGIGRGHFADYTGTLIAHNSAIEIAAETGLVGIFFWVAVLYLGFKQLWLFRQQTEESVDRSYATAVGISLAGYLISAMFVTLEYETLYFLLGMTAAIGIQLEEPVRFGYREAALVGGTIGVFMVAVRVFTAVYY